jgi:putative aldouronate transport system substrate-binding protein
MGDGKTRKRGAAGLAAALIILSAAAAFAAGSTEKPAEKITVDMFVNVANYQGIQGGWFGKILLDRFNMELNIIAPNVAGGGETLFLTRSAAGNLGDIIVIAEDRLRNTQKAGLLMDITDLLPRHAKDYAARFPGAVAKIKTYLGTDRVYAIPTHVSTQSPLSPLNFGEPDAGTYLRWDYYTGIGSPVMKTLDDLLPVLKQMQEKYPQSESGKKTYAFSLFKDWDGDMAMQNAALFPTMYGYSFMKSCFLSGDPARTEVSPLLDDNGIYYKTLKLYFKANQMGIVDPDSSSQNWDTLWNKAKDGQVLFSWWWWLCKGAYNSEERSRAGKGFAYVPIQDQRLHMAGYNPNGQYGGVIGIGSKAKQPERLMSFIGWLCAPEANEILAAGPRGLTWDIVNGRPALTAYGKDAEVKNTPVPAAFGSGGYKDGLPQLNFNMIQPSETDPTTGEPYDFRRWKSYLESQTTNLDTAWRKAMGAEDPVDYVKKHAMLVVAPGSAYVLPADGTEIAAKRSQSGQAIINASWQMVFARDEGEFNGIWKTVKEQARGFGYDEVLAWDRKICDELNAARRQTLAEAAKK